MGEAAVVDMEVAWAEAFTAEALPAVSTIAPGEPQMGIVRFALKVPHTFYVVAALILLLDVVAGREMPTDVHAKRRAIRSADAVIFNKGGLLVAVLENGIVHLRKIAIVRELGEDVEVNAGVKRGDRVVLNPSVDLMEGSMVRVRATDVPVRQPGSSS